MELAVAAEVPQTWVCVGFNAVRANDFIRWQRMASNYADSPDSVSFKLEYDPVFLPTAVDAITYERKNNLRKLGAAPSVTDKPVKYKLRDLGHEISETLFETDFVILKLSTQANLADALSKSELVLEQNGAYRVVAWPSPVDPLPFQDGDAWSVEVECLFCNSDSCAASSL